MIFISSYITNFTLLEEITGVCSATEAFKVLAAAREDKSELVPAILLPVPFGIINDELVIEEQLATELFRLFTELFNEDVDD